MCLIQNFAILGGDRRQYFLAGQLIADGFSVACCQVPGLPDTHTGLAGALAHAEAVLLPMPALDDAAHLRGSGIRVEDVRQSIVPGTRVFGGILPDGLFPAGVQFDYARDESLAVQNAALTAEGAVALALQSMPSGLAGTPVLVIGFGRIGKLLSRKLQALGALVTVSSRKTRDQGWCAALGYRAERTGLYAAGLSQYGCVFNTVPAPVFSAEQLAAIRCPILDLASAPGGLSAGAEPPANYSRAPGLPAKFAPAQAARILKTTIFRMLSEEQEALWNP